MSIEERIKELETEVGALQRQFTTLTTINLPRNNQDINEALTKLREDMRGNNETISEALAKVRDDMREELRKELEKHLNNVS
jgi:hypothetical protein